MSTKISFFTNLINIYTSPTETFRSLKEQHHFLYPILLILTCNAILITWYFSWVDFSWLQEQIVLMSGPDLSIAEQNQIRDGLSFMTPLIQGSITIVMMSLSLLLFTSIYSLYLMFISMIVDDSNRFKQWFAVIWWSYLPMLFSTLATAINIAMMPDNQLGLDKLSPLTSNNLFFQLGYESSLKPLLDSIDITLLWTIALFVLGYKTMTTKSWLTAFIVILFPMVLIYGIWFLIVY